ncbi:glycosyltransferase [Pseudomonas fluorescens]|uniref:glycosyltransferase n=1 Tax=Pseudomonas fluorescens TaxID=294 RepID=UPI001242D455|nr:glycosyltransferase [Pseudomonas fluorescens]VVN27792.1 putative glycosyltransferase [Pseudomonas fluorescens]
MNQHPMLSIITVCYNDLTGLKQTEESIKYSSAPSASYEWIVIDGGSTDGTKLFLESSKTVNSFISEQDKGIYDAMNKGTNIAKGSYVVYMNSGDKFTNLPLIINTIETPNHDLYFYDAIFVYGKYTRVKPARDFRYIKHSIPANHQAIIFKRELLGHSPYDGAYKICGDYKLLADLYVKKASHEIIHQTTAEFKVGGVSTHQRMQLLNEAYEVQRHTLKLGLVRSLISYIKRFISINLTLIIHRLSNATK